MRHVDKNMLIQDAKWLEGGRICRNTAGGRLARAVFRSGNLWFVLIVRLFCLLFNRTLWKMKALQVGNDCVTARSALICAADLPVNKA